MTYPYPWSGDIEIDPASVSSPVYAVKDEHGNVVGLGVGGESVAAYPLNNDIILVGDSFANLNIRRQFTASTVEVITGIRNLYIDNYGCPTGTASFEFRASDNTYRWSEPSGTFGAWTQLRNGMNVVQSGGGYRMICGVRLRHVPAVDSSGTSTIANNTNNAYSAEGDFAVLNIMAGAPFNLVGVHGIGGDESVDLVNRLDQVLNQEPNGNAYARKPGWVYLTSFGTNDIVPGETGLVETLKNLKTICDYFCANGCKVIASTLNARIRSTGVSLTSDEAALLATINDFYRDYATKNSNWFYLSDSFPATALQSANDYSAASGVLVDVVHLAQKGAYLRAKKSLSDYPQIALLAGKGSQKRMGPENIHPAYSLAGTGGTKGTGVSGTVPNNLTVARLGAGSDITCTASIVANTIDDLDGNWLRLEISNPGATTQSIGAYLSKSLGAWGLAVGDYVSGSHDVYVAAASLVDYMTSIITMKASSTALSALLSQNRTTSYYHKPVSGTHTTPRQQIVPTCDNIESTFRVYVRAGGSADVYIRLTSLIVG